MIYRKIAAISIRTSSWTICCWLVTAGVCAWFALQLPQVLGDHGLSTKGQYTQVQQRLSSDFHIPDEPVILLFENENGRTKQVFHANISRFLEHVERLSGVEVAASPFQHEALEKGKYAYALISILGSTKEKKIAMERIRHEISQVHTLKIRMTGKPVIQEDVNQSSKHDLKAAETIGIPIAFVLLLITFGGILPALIPILAGVMSVLIAMAVMYGIGKFGNFPLSVFVYNVIPMVGMAVCIDFALLMVSRFREEKAFLSVRNAIVTTMRTSGRAVTVSAACVILALIATFYIRMPIFNSVALGALVVITVSAMINLTFVPALLYVLGNRISPENYSATTRTGHGWRENFISTVIKRPAVSATVCLVVLMICLSPVYSMQTRIPGAESLPPGTESRLASEIMTTMFKPPELSQAFIIVDELNRDRIQHELERDNRVLRIDTDQSRVKQRVHLITVLLYGNETSREVMQWVREREKEFGAMNVLTGGEPKYHQEVHDEIFTRIHHVFAIVVLSNFLVLAWTFRSLLIPVKAILMNFLSIGASFGIITWLFETGRWGLEPSEIAIMVPVFIFGLSFGISMDYGIFLLSRINESFRMTRDNDKAVREGLRVSGKIITSAAAIMIAVTAPFVVAGVTGVKQLGIGIAAALFIDATLIRMVLVPSLMKMLGKWNWWMPFVRC